MTDDLRTALHEVIDSLISNVLGYLANDESPGNEESHSHRALVANATEQVLAALAVTPDADRADLRERLLNLCMAAQVVKWAHDEGRHHERQFDDLELQIQRAEEALAARSSSREASDD